MDLILMLLFVAGLSGTVTWLHYGHLKDERRTRLSTWRVAAAGAGLSVDGESGNLVTGPVITGHAGLLHVRLERYRPGKNKVGTRILVTGFGYGTGEMSLRRQDLLDGLVGGELATGAPDFDREVYLRMEAAPALAVLDAETRRKVMDLLRGSVTVAGRQVAVKAAIRNGTLEALLDESVVHGEDRLTEVSRAVLGEVLDVARRLVAPADPLLRIAENLEREPGPGVRLQSVRRLARENPLDGPLRAALLAACSDPSDEVRLAAATALGEQGHPPLRALIAEEVTDDACAARAITALGTAWTGGESAAQLRRALKRGRSQTTLACLDTLGRLAWGESEDLMIAALASADPDVAVAAARALGQAGTPRAVAALRAAAPVWLGDLRSAARQAIAEIQARLAGAAPGQLSLAGSEAGALSLAQNEPGRLSLDETPGQLGLDAAEPEGQS